MALAAAPGAWAATAEEPVFSVIAGSDWEGRVPDTGPDTFQVFDRASGRVEVSTEMRFSGSRALRLSDAAGDGDFPELQGTFAPRYQGLVLLHFAFLTATPAEEWNAALVGATGFHLGPGGIALWLGARDGHLFHVSDSIPKRLLALESFVWYLVDVFYDVESGRYDLAVRREGVAAPVVALGDQPNAANRAKAAVERFSFIGDRGDDVSNVVYFVDDLAIGVADGTRAPQLVAPGRRQLFLDSLPAPAPPVGPAGALAEDPWAPERAGDEAWRAGDRAAAERAYQAARAAGVDPARVLLKLADLRFLAGDLAGERDLRERIYGTLDPSRKPPAERRSPAPP